MNTWQLAFIGLLGKEAADAVTKRTVSAQTVRPGTEEAKLALSAGLKPAAHVAPTRYGRKPYTRGVRRNTNDDRQSEP